MELTYYINGTLIDEPIGFDSLKMLMKRHEYHGMSAEVSEQTLEFYGRAADMIHDAYNDDIDTELRYIVMADGTEVYNGVIDLSTYEEQRSQYYSVSCKVGEVGVKTTFNNRTKTEVDLNSAKTVDGENAVLTKWENIKIPRKSLLYTNYVWQNVDSIVETGDGTTVGLVESKFKTFLSVIPNKQKANEYGSIGNLIRIMSSSDTITGSDNNPVVDSSIRFTDDQDMAVWYKSGDDWSDTYGNVTTHKVEVDLSVDIKFSGDIFVSDGNGYVITGDKKLTGKIIIAADNEIIGTSNPYIFTNGDTSTHTLTLKGSWEVSVYKDIYVGVLFEHSTMIFTIIAGVPTFYQANLGTSFTATASAGNYVKTTMWDNLQTDSVFAQMKLVCNVLSDIIRKISENQLLLASDWYGLARMQAVGVTGKGFGGGALKAITNGYKIRGLFEDENGEKRSMPISFEKAVKSLDMLDCIGWGFSEENGLTRVRVERWNWFYKDAVTIRISSPNEIKREIDADRYYNEFSIGYKKYETSDNYNSIDTYHGERTFVSPMKSIANAKEVSCDFIADNYAIEETRRARFQVDASEEFKYDENLFVFELSAKTAAITNVITGYSVVNNLTSSEGVQRPTEQINVQLSPRRCAERWNSFLHRLNNRRALAFSAGKNNCEAVLQCNVTGGSVIQARTNYLEDFIGGEAMKENQEMEYTAPLFKAETLSFTYPLTISQYKAIKANPYGLIEVDGIQGWIKEFTYTFNTGEAEFKLIPKA